MKRFNIRLSALILILCLFSCSYDLSDNLCSVEFTVEHEGGSGKSMSVSVSSLLNYEYSVQPYDSGDTESGWTAFDADKSLVVNNIKPGMWCFKVRAVKDGTVYYQGSTELSLASSVRKSIRILLKKADGITGKGTLVIKDSCDYSGLTVKLRFTGQSEENRTCPGVAEYSKNLDEGFYSVSVVYYKDSVLVGGYGFAVYIPACGTVNVNLNTALIDISQPIETTVDFISLSAPYSAGKVCTGYSKNGVKVEFPYKASLKIGQEVNITNLGLVPLYTNLSDISSVLSADCVELWAKDLPYNGFFSGNMRSSEKTPKIIVLNADAGRIGHACLAYLRDLETAYLKGAVTLGESTFASCKKLKDVYFSDSFLNFSNAHFDGCTALKDIYFARSSSEGMFFSDLWNYNAPKDIKLHYGVKVN